MQSGKRKPCCTPYPVPHSALSLFVLHEMTESVLYSVPVPCSACSRARCEKRAVPVIRSAPGCSPFQCRVSFPCRRLHNRSVYRLFRAEWAFSFRVKTCISIVFPAVLCLFLRRMGAVMCSVLYNMLSVLLFPFCTVLLSRFSVPDSCSLPSFPCRRYEWRRRLSCSLSLLYIRRDILLNMIKECLHTVQPRPRKLSPVLSIKECCRLFPFGYRHDLPRHDLHAKIKR